MAQSSPRWTRNAGFKVPLLLTVICLARLGFAASWPPRSAASAAGLVLRYASLFNALDSTYDGTQIIDIKSDSSGRLYILGNTDSTHFPFPAPQPSRLWSGKNDVFVARLDPTGATVEYLNLLGGSGDDRAGGLFVASDGAAYVTGYTKSPDFPVTPGAYRTSLGTRSTTAFAAKLDPSGSAWLYVTLLDGQAGSAIAADAAGNAYITGSAASDFPTSPGALQRTWKGVSDGFVTKLNPAGSALVYSTLLGGSGLEQPWGIAVDPQGNVYVAGETQSADFPVTPGAFRTQYGGGYDDAFVAKINPGGTALLFGSYLSSGAAQYGLGMALDSQGRIWLAGTTGTSAFPVTQDAAQPTFAPGAAYLARFSADASHLEYATFFGDLNFAVRMTLDGSGSVWIAGATNATDLPVPPGTSFPGAGQNAFVAQFDAASGALRAVSYLGGRGDDGIHALAPGPSGSIYLAGGTWSPDFPATPHALEPFLPCTGSSLWGNPQFVARMETGTPQPLSFVSVSAASYAPYALAPASIASGFGAGLAAEIASAQSLPLPTSLGGVSVTITDSAGVAHAAPLFFVSPNQINYYVPDDTQPGLATVTVSSGASGQAFIDTVVPGVFFMSGLNGAEMGAAIALRVSPDGTRTQQFTVDPTVTPGPDYLPIDLGSADDQTYLSLYGTGIRGGTGLAGVRALLYPPPVPVTGGALDLNVTGMGVQSQYVGLDQVNVLIPNSLRAAGPVTLMLCVDGRAANKIGISIH